MVDYKPIINKSIEEAYKTGDVYKPLLAFASSYTPRSVRSTYSSRTFDEYWTNAYLDNYNEIRRRDPQPLFVNDPYGDEPVFPDSEWRIVGPAMRLTLERIVKERVENSKE